MNDTIKIRWLDVSDEMLMHELIVGNDHDTKVKALGRLGIKVQDGKKPLDAWIRAMCEENDLPHTIPAPDVIGDAIVYSPAASFMWWLA